MPVCSCVKSAVDLACCPISVCNYQAAVYATMMQGTTLLLGCSMCGDSAVCEKALLKHGEAFFRLHMQVARVIATRLPALLSHSFLCCTWGGLFVSAGLPKT